MIRFIFSLQDSHRDLICQIESPPFHRSRGCLNKNYEFYDLIVDWLEQSYLVSHVVGNKLQSFLVPNKKLNADKDTLTRCFWGLFRNYIHHRGKHLYSVVVTNIFAHWKYLNFNVQFVQVFVLSVAHYYLYILIAYIFVDASWEWLQWLHWKFHFTYPRPFSF